MKLTLGMLFLPFWFIFLVVDVTLLDENCAWNWDSPDNDNLMCRIARYLAE